MTDPENNLQNIDHIVVLMIENRSFDNVLGCLYTPENPPSNNQTFEGIEMGQIAVPANLAPDGKPYMPSQGTIMSNPNPDPGEVYADIYNQQFNTQLPADQIPNTTAVPPMTGFVIDYANHNTAEPQIIMQGFSPVSLPVINGLAANFCVCDHWYSSIPSQTFCNRSFVHAGTSSGYVNNKWSTGKWPWDLGIFLNSTSTIYNVLENASVSWRIYYGGPALMCNAWLTQEQLKTYYHPTNPTNIENRFFDMTQFKSDAATGLPGYSFIEPNFLDHKDYGPENDYHPPYPPILSNGGPSNVLNGEELVYQVYEALFGEGAANPEGTLLILTFDEHGGTFDHVPPTATISPDGIVIPVTKPGGSGFNFERLGVRVPTVLISPWISPGLVCHTEFDHTSIIKTAINRFSLPDDQLGERVKQAPDLSEVLSNTCHTNYPKITPRPVPPFNPSDAAKNPISDFQREMCLALAAKGKNTDVEFKKVTKLKSVQDLCDYLDEA